MAVRNFDNLFNAIHEGKKVIVRLMPDYDEECDICFTYGDVTEKYAMQLACVCEEPSFKKAHKIHSTFSHRWATVEDLKWAFTSLEDMDFTIECYDGDNWDIKY